MNDSSETQFHLNDPTRLQTFIQLSRIAVPAIILIAMIVTFGLGFLEFIFCAIFGWIEFLINRWGRIQPDWTAVWLGFSALVLFVMGMVIAARRLLSTWGKAFRAAVGVSLVLFASFASGTAIIGAVHQIAWMVTQDVPMFVYGADFASREESRSNLSWLAWSGVHWQALSHPLNSTNRSWESTLFEGTSPLRYGGPDESQYVEVPRPHRADLPWDSLENRAIFTKLPSIFVNPGLGTLYPHAEFMFDEHGYGLNSYSANHLVMGENGWWGKHSFNADDSTILFGEVRSHFHPWGKPGNVRDLSLGINKRPSGFGGPFKNGCQFSFLSGEVRLIDEGVDPKVLEAMATPDGGETVPEEF